MAYLAAAGGPIISAKRRPDMTDFIRTPDDNFADLAAFPFQPNYHR